tara:strand:- start:132 stop:329 length:198 start_codon:yes stop_codon:yes gene_type:complete
MVLFTLTEAALDIGAAIIWWSAKNTYYGIKYGYNYFFNQPEKKDNYEMEVLQIKNCSCKHNCSCY